MSSIEDFINLQVPSVVHKDDCGYCFETMYNDDTKTSHSLNICLRCFQSFCSDHTNLHEDVTQHELNERHDFYLKLTKVKKPDAEHPVEKKLKLEVTEKSDDDAYDSFWCVVQGTTTLVDHETKPSNPEVQSKVDHILSARSNNFQQMASSWQLEVKPCIHVDSLTIASSEPQNIGSSCAECGLENNLWLCLHCGHLGCGRQQIGIQGQSHGLSHYQEYPDHSLAVKLGSLSYSSSDVYCYCCDDEVQFANAESWTKLLGHWGIDIRGKVAQEKTLVELQIEQNMNWDFQMVDSQGHDLQHLKSSQEYGCGLINLGNSCYMNSVLQILMNGGISSWSLDQLGDFPTDVVYVSSNLKCQLIKLRNAMKIDPAKYSRGVRPSTFKNCVGATHEEFSSGRQQDALEFFSYFTDLLDNKVFDKASSNPNDLLKFTLQDRLECTQCHGVKYSTQASDYLQVPLSETDKPQVLAEQIARYFEGEEVSFTCPACSKQVTAVKSSGFQSFPDTLVVSPTRIKLVNWVPTKTSQEVLMPGIQATDKTPLNLGIFKSPGFNGETEQLLPENEETAVFIPSAQSVSSLSEMGFTENASMRALYFTNNSSTEDAMNWLFQHVEDSDLNDPFVVPAAIDVTASVSASHLADMMSMGLDSQLCRKALVLNKGDVSASVEWVFNNLDDNSNIQEEQAEPEVERKVYGCPDQSRANYLLKAVICHKGSSVQSGHYVAFIKKKVKNETKWVLYNDEKIVVADDKTNIEELKKNGYIYLFQRC
ncbi:LANO_0A03158g1_1 [Lachancea nothofagi CBS 11611]|uniref:Ubiquitin carboxyl-terminal hydrolase n=1 Tax=Lachancea nothofagi CBS 11611 TaxID=1266666 RepID=A0A1G4IP50_9SACH|nr:LANO_0A03158g1_1 [Lachancea nothofagi CBS 11611]